MKPRLSNILDSINAIFTACIALCHGSLIILQAISLVAKSKFHYRCIRGKARIRKWLLEHSLATTSCHLLLTKAHACTYVWWRSPSSLAVNFYDNSTKYLICQDPWQRSVLCIFINTYTGIYVHVKGTTHNDGRVIPLEMSIKVIWSVLALAWPIHRTFQST